MLLVGDLVGCGFCVWIGCWVVVLCCVCYWFVLLFICVGGWFVGWVCVVSFVVVGLVVLIGLVLDVFVWGFVVGGWVLLVVYDV